MPPDSVSGEATISNISLCFEYCEYIKIKLYCRSDEGNRGGAMAAQERHIFDIPNDEEAKLAADSGRVLASCSGHGETATLRLIDDEKDITVPVKAIHMLADILNQMAQGNAISIVPIHAELTTQQAADILNVSRPYLIKNILDAGKLAYHKSGTRRKILYKDLLAYKNDDLAERKALMAELAKQAQELGMME